jgi:hypothetical protein
MGCARDKTRSSTVMMAMRAPLYAYLFANDHVKNGNSWRSGSKLGIRKAVLLKLRHTLGTYA